MQDNVLIKPVFIIGLHRTGSTFLKNIINRNSKIAMATDEMDLMNPWKKIKTFAYHFERLIKKNQFNHGKKIIDLIFKGGLVGTFWKDYSALDIDWNKLEKSIDNLGLSETISVILDKYREVSEKERVGVKYPLHFSKAKILRQYYPDCKILFLFRDARAICASKVNDEATVNRKKKLLFLSPLIHYTTLSFFIFEYLWATIFYLQNKDKLDIYPVCYEKLISFPEQEVKKICSYCEIPYEKIMLEVIGKPSSHTRKIAVGADIDRLNAWQGKLNVFDKYFISLFTKFSMKKLGYGFMGIQSYQ